MVVDWNQDRTGTNADFKARAQSTADRREHRGEHREHHGDGQHAHGGSGKK